MACDLDRDGKLDFEEFKVIAFNHFKVLSNKNLNKIFKVLDLKKD